ncbi:MAG: dihydrolipoyl dehydrogenase [Actinomycetota bacterium]
MPDDFDLIVLGGGTGGYSAALRAASLGLRVALVEKEKVGGTCLHRGCIPTKALLHAGEVIDTVRESETFGIKAGEPSYDWAGVQTYKDRVVDRMFKGLQGLIKARKIESIAGSGTITSPTTVRAGDREVRAKNICVATGSVPRMIPGLERGARVVTSDEALVNGIPRSAIVLGGGSVGVEFASIWRSFGAEVTVVEMLPTLVPLEDADLGKELERAFKKRGIKVLTGGKFEDAKVTDDGVAATVSQNGSSQQIEAEVLLCAVGRGPVTQGSGIDAIGVKTERGFILVNDRCETNVKGVFAVGDVIPTPGLAHVSFAEGMLVAEHLAGMKPPAINYDAIPRATYSTPEVGAVGLTESQARERGHNVRTEKTPLSAIGKAVILGNTTGFCKIVAAEDGAILGAHYIGPRVTELIAEGMLAVGWEAMPEEVAQLIHPHPSLSEVFGETSLHMAGRALHTA